MTKQEFLAMSLPFSLKCLELQHRGDKNGEIGTFTGYELDMFSIIQDIRLPILHPLSDLTKEIEHKGEKFVPIEKLYHLDIMRCDISLFENISIDVVADHIFSNQFLKFTLKLIEWHFDICGLIEKGEAIDINTLSENPYK